MAGSLGAQGIRGFFRGGVVVGATSGGVGAGGGRQAPHDSSCSSISMGAAESGRAAAGPTSAAGSGGGFSSNQTPLRLKASGALFTGGSGASAFSTVAAAGALVFFACGDFGRDLAFAFFGSAGLAFACGDFGRDLAFGSVRRLSASTILRNSPAPVVARNCLQRVLGRQVGAPFLHVGLHVRAVRLALQVGNV